MSVELLGALGLAFVLCILHGRAEYWKARATTVEKERDFDGWEDEARFWRRVFHRSVADEGTES